MKTQSHVIIKNNVMESVIKWQTGEPKEDCGCLVTLNDGNIVAVFYSTTYRWYFYTGRILAWCPISEIEPYKEETIEQCKELL